MDGIPFTYTFKGQEYKVNVQQLDDDNIYEFLSKHNDTIILRAPTDTEKKQGAYVVAVGYIQDLSTVHSLVYLQRDDSDIIYIMYDTYEYDLMDGIEKDYLLPRLFRDDVISDIKQYVKENLVSKVKRYLDNIQYIQTVLERPTNIENSSNRPLPRTNNPNNNAIQQVRNVGHIGGMRRKGSTKKRHVRKCNSSRRK